MFRELNNAYYIAYYLFLAEIIIFVIGFDQTNHKQCLATCS